MKKASPNRQTEDMRPEYDFSGGGRGKYAAKFAEGAIMVVLEPDLAKVFRSSAAVNKALRSLRRVSETTRA